MDSHHWWKSSIFLVKGEGHSTRSTETNILRQLQLRGVIDYLG